MCCVTVLHRVRQPQGAVKLCNGRNFQHLGKGKLSLKTDEQHVNINTAKRIMS